MRGYGADSYGDGFADVYDDWYADVTDVEATVARVVDLAGPAGRVLELGVGTGRLAVPLALAGLEVVGIDSSRTMLDRLHERDRAGAVTAVCGDMVGDMPEGPFDVVLVAYNTIFNLQDQASQQRCFEAVAARLAPGGVFVVETFVPDAGVTAGSDISLRTMAVDQVVLSVSQQHPDEQRASGQFVQLSESGGVRLRPWSIRWAPPDELDAMAATAGLELAARWSDMAGSAFDDDSTQQVSVYRMAPTVPPTASPSAPRTPADVADVG